jgi:hypothetical protein
MCTDDNVLITARHQRRRCSMMCATQNMFDYQQICYLPFVTYDLIVLNTVLKLKSFFTLFSHMSRETLANGFESNLAHLEDSPILSLKISCRSVEWFKFYKGSRAACSHRKGKSS